MSLLTSVNYDPTVAVSKATSSLLAMTAFDTTNLRLNFTAPPSGNVMVRMRCTVNGATTSPTILLGVMSGSNIVARQSPIGAISGTSTSTVFITQEALFTKTGLTSGSPYVWDAAYGVEIVLAGTNIKYGGPDNATGNNAWGGFSYEIYSAADLLASKMYDPSTAVSKATTAYTSMSPVDTTNLRISFNAPSSGSVLVRMRAPVHGATTYPQLLFGVLSGSNVVCRTPAMGGLKTTAVATAQLALEGQCVVNGLTSGSPYVWDAAYATQVIIGSTGLKYGGPNNTTTNDAWGGFLYEIWSL